MRVEQGVSWVMNPTGPNSQVKVDCDGAPLATSGLSSDETPILVATNQNTEVQPLSASGRLAWCGSSSLLADNWKAHK